MPVPSDLRVTRFYDDVLTGLRRLARLPVVPVPAGRVPDMGGPEVTSWADLLRGYLRASHRHRWLAQIVQLGH